MKFAIDVPNFGSYGDARTVAGLSRETEAAGWDGFFIWDHVMYFTPEPVPVVDPWTALTAAAMTTERIRLGPMVTPLARRRPWTVARQAAYLDRLSNGRLVLGVGLGEPPENDYGRFGEETDARTRADKLDEALEIVTSLWSGEEVTFRGKHYNVGPARFTPPPAQRPRVPVWVAGAWPNKRPFRRAARWDGVVPIKVQTGPGFENITPDEVRASADYVRSQRDDAGGYDVVVGGESPIERGGDFAAHVRPFADAGATWWMEALTDFRGPLDKMREIVRNGPPQL